MENNVLTAGPVLIKSKAAIASTWLDRRRPPSFVVLEFPDDDGALPVPVEVPAEAFKWLPVVRVLLVVAKSPLLATTERVEDGGELSSGMSPMVAHEFNEEKDKTETLVLELLLGKCKIARGEKSSIRCKGSNRDVVPRGLDGVRESVRLPFGFETREIASFFFDRYDQPVRIF